MYIKKGWLHEEDDDPVRVVKTKKMGGDLTTTGIVMHYTAGWSTAGDVATLATSERRASAHLVVGRDGAVTQIVPFDRQAWHAGPSKFRHDNRNYVHLNQDTIGIEISNAGWIKKINNASGNFVDQYGQVIAPDGRFIGQTRKTQTPPSEWHQEYHPFLAKGEYAWEPYYPPQLQVLDEIVAALLKAYPIKFICSHEEIDTRKWKTDPGPMFPMRRYLKMLEARDDGAEAADEKPHPARIRDAEPPRAEELFMLGTVMTITNVHFRKSPAGKVISVLPRGVIMKHLSTSGAWCEVRTPEGYLGYVNRAFVIDMKNENAEYEEPKG